MANSRQDLVEQLQQRYLECGICSELYDEQTRIPKLLPCLHTLCMACLVGLNNGNKIKCPFCNKSHHIKREDIANLPKDNTRRDLTCFLQNNTEVNCGVCNKTALDIRICNACDINMCVDCQRQHNKIFEEHCFENYAAPRLSNGYTCKLTGHENGHMRYFCKEAKCNQIICATCSITKHKGHKIEDIENVISNEKEFFSYLIERLRDKITTAELFKDSIVPGLKHTTRKLDTEIEHTRLNLSSLLACELERLSKHKNDQVQYIANVENNVHAFIRNARDCCEFSQQLLQNSNEHTFFILEQATKEKIFCHLNIKMDEMNEKCRFGNKWLEKDTNHFKDILEMVSISRRKRHRLRNILACLDGEHLFYGMDVMAFVKRKTQAVSTTHCNIVMVLLYAVFITAGYVFADKIPHLLLGSDIDPQLRFIFNNSPSLFPCRSPDNKTVSSKPYSRGFICSERRYKFKGIFGNTSLKNDQAYKIDFSVRIEGIKQGIHDERVFFEIGLSRNKVHDSYVYENKEHAWVVYGVNCGTDLCLQYNDRLLPYIQRIKHDEESNLLETRLGLSFEPKTKSLHVISNSSTVIYTFTNVSAADADLWPICGIYPNDNLISMSIISSSPSFVTFDASTSFPGLFVSKDGREFANWNNSVSGNQFHNPISSYIFSQPMIISDSQEEVFYTVEIIIQESRCLPNNTILFEVGTFGKKYFGTEFLIKILKRYDFEQNSLGYFTKHMNETLKLCDSNSTTLPVFTIKALVSFHVSTNSFNITLYCNNDTNGINYKFYEQVIDKYPPSVPQFYIRKTCIFCRPYIEAKIRMVNFRELFFILRRNNHRMISNGFELIFILCSSVIIQIIVYIHTTFRP